MKRLGTLAMWIAMGAAVAYGQAAVVTVEGSERNKTPVNIEEFATSGAQAVTFRQTLANDLKLSGWFQVTPERRGVVFLRGECRASGGKLSAQCRVSIAGGKTYLSKSYTGSVSDARDLAHKVADEIVWAVKKTRGIASTRIVMIRSHGGAKELYTCDADGQNLQAVTRENAICLSPAWSPDGRSLVYTSFHGGFPDVYELVFETGSRVRRRKLAGYPGLNAGAAISPDGRNMALTLSKDGNPDLYIMQLGSRKLTRVTRTRANESSPSWSPDGKQLAYVSDAAGAPHVYVRNVATGSSRRVSFRGKENVSPDWGPGDRIAFSSKREGRYHVCVVDLGSGREVQLTSGNMDYEDPSWARDGRHIVCTGSVRYQSSLYILDILGDAPLRLIQSAGDWYQPDWSEQ